MCCFSAVILQLIGGRIHPDEGQSSNQTRAEETATGPISSSEQPPEELSDAQQKGGEENDSGSAANGAQQAAEGGVSAVEALVSETARMVQGKTGGGEPAEAGSAPYEFLPQEEQLLELVMNGMRVAGIALALEALSTLLLGRPRPPCPRLLTRSACSCTVACRVHRTMRLAKSNRSSN